MGGGGSKPAPPPTVIEQEPPAGSGQSSIIYPDRPETPRLDGISRALANECNGCNLQVVSGVSSSSVKISREYGFVSTSKCLRYKRDLQSVRDKKLSFQDFLNNLQSGEYLRDLGNGYCEQVKLSSEDEAKITKFEQFDEGKLQSIRIQQMSSGGFSADTKVKITPSIPFRMRFTTAGQGTTEITIKSMTLYHPCPLRLEGVQPDAVLSLNDPSFDDPNYVVLIPLVGRNGASSSIQFLNKIMPQVGAVSQADPSSGAYVARDVPTGADWTLSKLFTVQPSTDGNFDVVNGFYEWKGMPALQRVREDGNGTITYSWKESGKPSPRYLMIDSPVECSPSDLAVLTQRMPVTPAGDAVHAVLYSSNPFQRGIVHKQGPSNCETKEAFTDLQGAYDLATGTQEEDEACDAWTYWANRANRGFTSQQITNFIFNVLVFVAMAIGASLALSAVLRMYDKKAAGLAEGIGQVTAVFFKNLQQKASALQMGSVGLKSLASGPGLATFADSAKPAPQALITDAAKETKGLMSRITDAAKEVEKEVKPMANLPRSSADVPPPVAASFLPTPDGQHQRGVFKTGTFGRGRITRGRDRVGLTRRGAR